MFFVQFIKFKTIAYINVNRSLNIGGVDLFTYAYNFIIICYLLYERISDNLASLNGKVLALIPIAILFSYQYCIKHDQTT